MRSRRVKGRSTKLFRSHYWANASKSEGRKLAEFWYLLWKGVSLHEWVHIFSVKSQGNENFKLRIQCGWSQVHRWVLTVAAWNPPVQNTWWWLPMKHSKLAGKVVFACYNLQPLGIPMHQLVRCWMLDSHHQQPTVTQDPVRQPISVCHASVRDAFSTSWDSQCSN